MAYESFEGLKIWQKGRELKKEIWQLVKSFPPEEKYRLVDQIVRSSRSYGNQLAEGHGRQTYKDKLRFTIMARGSLSETLGHFIDAYDCEYINDEELKYYRIKIAEIEKMTSKYVGYLESQIAKGLR